MMATMTARRLSVRKRLLFTAISMLLAFLALEACLRFVPLTAWLEGDELWEYVYWKRHADQGGPAARWRRLPEYSSDRHSPSLGWISRPGYRSTQINTNGAGLRGLREYPLEKPTGERRIVVIGDSFTFGEDVGDEETYCHYLETSLKDVPVLNFGVHGYGTDQQYLMLKERGFPYRPDLVILGFYVPDIDRNVLAFRDFAKPVFRVVDDRWVLRNVPVPAPEEIHLNVPSRFSPRSFRFLCVQTHAFWRSLDHEMSEEVRVSLGILDLIRQDCLDRRVKFLLLVIPEQLQVKPPPAERALLHWAKSNGTSCVDMRAVFDRLHKEQQTRLYNHVPGHWTPSAHEICAAALQDEIDRSHLLAR
jgi:hypothetical protein